MALFVGTLLIVLLCCLAMGVGLLMRGQPLTGGCGGKPPGAAACANCPNRKRNATSEGH